MGEIADMHLDGTVCEACGDYLDGEPEGFPRYCSNACEPADDELITRTKKGNMLTLSEVIKKHPMCKRKLQKRCKEDKSLGAIMSYKGKQPRWLLPEKSLDKL